ncbi:MAG: flagellar hook-associated protein FlgL [Gammaproteobacteria bacterium]|nr:flagellar hook-associated protein FlgL [Gammaproteobacteria bacterium]
MSDIRLSTSQLHNTTTSQILKNQSDVYRTQTQLATGKRILSPSDDPRGAASLVDLTREIARSKQYQDNGFAAKERLDLEDQTLGSAATLLQRINELGVYGNNGALGATERGYIAAEIEGYYEEMLSIVNAKGNNGEYLFAGYKSSTTPFAKGVGVDASGAPVAGSTIGYSGDDNRRQIYIADELSLASADPGSEVFQGKGVTNGVDMFRSIEDMINNLKNNTPDIANANGKTDQENIGAVMEQILLYRSKVGARLHTIETQNMVHEDFQVYLQTSVSRVEDVDIAEAVTRLNQQMMSLQAVQQTYMKTQGLSLFNYL